MKALALSMVILFGLPLLAQAPPENPSAPSTVMQDRVSVGLNPAWLPAVTVNPQPNPDRQAVKTSAFLASTRPAKRQAHVFDRKFATLLGVATAMSIVDVQLTQRCIEADTCHEVNPIYGSNPSAGRMYGISFAILGGETLVSRWLRKYHPESSAWIAPLVATSAAHGAGAITAGIR
jgi:hypothetical protein